MNQDLGAVFARHVFNTRFEDIPAPAIDSAKKSVLDTFGVILGASSTTPVMKGFVESMRDIGGKPESTIMGFGGKVPATTAALLNGAMAHCLDFDDHLPEGHHPSSAVVPAAFAMAERLGGVDGRAFITAVALGQDVFTRLRRHVEWKQDWMMSPVVGVIAAAAACGKLAGLDVERLTDAMGIAISQAGGTMEMAYGIGGNLRGMYSSFPCQGGVLSVIMAQSGISAVQSAFEGKAGFFQCYFAGKWDGAAMRAGLGKDFLGSEIAYKPWPSCGLSHVYIDTTQQMMREHGLGPEDIAKITVHVGDFAEKLCLPIETRRKPQTTVDAKFSIPFCVAVTAVHGNVGIGAFTDKGLQDAKVLDFATKVNAVVDPKFNWTSALPSGLVEIVTSDGRQLSKPSSGSLGDINHPLSWDDILKKFRDCVAYSVNPPSTADIEGAISAIRSIEKVADVARIMTALTPSKI